MKRQSGFTLIELVVAIVLMATLSSMATIRILNFQSDARAAKIDDVAANLRTGIDMIFAKSAIDGVEQDCPAGTKVEVESFFVCNGYPIAFIASVERLLNIDTNASTARLFVRNKADDGEHQNPDEQEHLVAAITFVEDSYTFETEGNFCQVLYRPHRTPQIVKLQGSC